MGFVDQVLWEFKGQLSLNDIYHMTYKELGYLREHRNRLREELAKSPGTGATEALSQLSNA